MGFLGHGLYFYKMQLHLVEKQTQNSRGGFHLEEDLKSFEFGVDDVGIFLMESITTGLYKNPMNVLREYISNEMDNEPPASKIELKLESKKVTISGNGPGMDFDGIREAVRVGFSPKDVVENIGFRGIGIYSGVAICDRVVLTTKRTDNQNYYHIIIDCKGLRKDVAKGESISLVESLESNVGWKEIPASKALRRRYGTVVQLIDINEDFEEILDYDSVRNYLETTVPVKFERTFPYRGKIDSHLKKQLGRDFKVVDLKLDGKPVYKSPKYISLDSPDFGTINKGKRLVGVYWICQNSKTGKIDDEQSRGLLYRKKGFAIGNRSTVANVFADVKNKHLVEYVTGEIHITSSRLLPNTERVEFEASPDRDALEEALRKKVLKSIVKMSRTKSAKMRAEQRIEQASELLNTRPEFADREDWLSAITNAKRLRDNLRNDKKNKLIPNVMKKKVETKLKRVESWLLKNSEPPKEEVLAEEAPSEAEESAVIEGSICPDCGVVLGADETTCSGCGREFVGEIEEGLPAEAVAGVEEEKPLPKWIPGAVEEMCHRVGHSDWSDAIFLIMEVLTVESILKNDEEIRDVLEKIEHRLAL